MPKYTEIPNAKGYAKKTNKHLCMKLSKSLYGMVEDPSLQFSALVKALTAENFIQSKFDPCLFYHPTKHIILITYVDDVILFCKDKNELDDLFASLRLKHPLTDADIGDNFYDY